MSFVKIHKKDNVHIDLESGHKYAVCDIAKGERVIKYGFPIGIATENIKSGQHVHSHNLKTALSGKSDYTYTPDFTVADKKEPFTVMAYRRENGQVGNQTPCHFHVLNLTPLSHHCLKLFLLQVL